MSAVYEVVIFTASLKYYADRIMKILDPRRQYVSNMLYRDSCCKTKSGKLVKDLSVIAGVPMEDMILVDNNMYSLWPQPSNGVPILHFTFDKQDQELETLADLLDSVTDKPHQDLFADTFRVKEMMHSQDLSDYYSCFDVCF